MFKLNQRLFSPVISLLSAIKGTETKTIQSHLKCFKVVTVEAAAAVCFHFIFNGVKRGFAAVNMSFDTFQHCWCVQVIPGL